MITHSALDQVCASHLYFTLESQGSASDFLENDYLTLFGKPGRSLSNTFRRYKDVSSILLVSPL